VTQRRESSGASPDAGEEAPREVYLFAAGQHRAVSRWPDPSVLPQLDRPWLCHGTVPLGVQHVELPGTEPEPVITALLNQGYFVWTVSTDEEAAL
jgi:hypothetical protein